MKGAHNLLVKRIVLSLFVLAVMVIGNSARADLKQIKAYKEAFPESKPKCIDCHTTEKPKKDDGEHDPNDYGKAIVAASTEAGNEEPTAETYQKVGQIENFGK